MMKLGVGTRKCQISLATVSNVMENCDSASASLEILDFDSTSPRCQEVEHLQGCSSNSRGCKIMK